MTILFYSTKEEPYGCFSNFSLHSFDLNGHHWKTSEHYFQAYKFIGTEYFGQVMRARRPSEAAKLGRQRNFPLRQDWESVKEQIMHQALEAKFTQNQDLKQILLSTGDQELIENSPTDYYWGCGADGSGKNRLGVILMQLREQLKRSSQ
ncbi:unnamed protein product [Brachionus calyciflorus]|uniref:NADAR domain-containing protein n=1 Tax=Brachionus calyciflorus TaxID=104777 RepID=A0A814DLZ0_9BILA|nr:unnamed protein product [Brachionus calyciflorus]